ncbi:hypothetical protein [Paenibacillus sp. NPDC058174]|uniref:hypothetical protein n=1 Tax=Paenibacillus sp. NPDC058174 TaxID=3346366 RepID=UPI0036D7A6D2
MKLQVELWAERTNAFEYISQDLFKEAISCYKIGAFRSAFLMSYLTLMQTIRQRVLNFTIKPEHVEERKWSNFRTTLSGDRNWEEAVANIIMMNKPKFNKDSNTYETDRRIIKLANHDEVIDEFINWRNKRNQCAHAKSGTINGATVECFWNFIQDNLFKFHVNGGLEYYKESLFKSFRDQYESVNITFIDHLNALPTAELDKTDLMELWEYLEKRIDGLQRLKIESSAMFWSEILFHRDEVIKNSFIDFVKSDPVRFIRFYNIVPDVLSFIMQQSGAHLFKKDILHEWIEKKFHYVEERSFWKLVTEIIEKYTPKEDLLDFFKYINPFGARILPNEHETAILKKNLFFESMEQELCSQLTYIYEDVPLQLRDIDKTNYLLGNITLNPKIVRHLNSYMDKLGSYHYPMTNELYYSLKRFIQDNKDFSIRLKSMATDSQISLCQTLVYITSIESE